MAATAQSPVSVQERISFLRYECLVNRILYYVFNSPKVTTYDHDAQLRELHRMCTMYPSIATSTPYFGICPTQVVEGYSADDYPPELVEEAQKRL